MVGDRPVSYLQEWSRSWTCANMETNPDSGESVTWIWDLRISSPRTNYSATLSRLSRGRGERGTALRHPHSWAIRSLNGVRLDRELTALYILLKDSSRQISVIRVSTIPRTKNQDPRGKLHRTESAPTFHDRDKEVKPYRSQPRCDHLLPTDPAVQMAEGMFIEFSLCFA